MGGKNLYFTVLILFLINLLFTAVITTGVYGPIAWYVTIFVLLFVLATSFFIGFNNEKSWTNLMSVFFFVVAIINSIVFWAFSKNLSGAVLLIINLAGLEISMLKMTWFKDITSFKGYFSKKEAIEKELPDIIEEPALIIEEDEDIKEESPIQFIGNTATMTFHIPTCRYSKQIKIGNKVLFDSRKEAIKSKYKPCKCTKI